MNVEKNSSKMAPAEKTDFENTLLALKADTTSPGDTAANMATAKNRYIGVHSNGSSKSAAMYREIPRQFDLEAVTGPPFITIPYWDCVAGRASSDAGPDFMGGMGAGQDKLMTPEAFAENTGWLLNIRACQKPKHPRLIYQYLKNKKVIEPKLCIL